MHDPVRALDLSHLFERRDDVDDRIAFTRCQIPCGNRIITARSRIQSRQVPFSEIDGVNAIASAITSSIAFNSAGRMTASKEFSRKTRIRASGSRILPIIIGMMLPVMGAN